MKILHKKLPTFWQFLCKIFTLPFSLIEQAEGPPERVSPAIIAENSNKKPGGPYLGTLSLFYDFQTIVVYFYPGLFTPSL